MESWVLTDAEILKLQWKFCLTATAIASSLIVFMVFRQGAWIVTWNERWANGIFWFLLRIKTSSIPLQAFSYEQASRPDTLRPLWQQVGFLFLCPQHLTLTPLLTSKSTLSPSGIFGGASWGTMGLETTTTTTTATTTKDKKRKGKISVHWQSDITHVDLGKNEMANGVNILGFWALLLCKAKARLGKRPWNYS